MALPSSYCSFFPLWHYTIALIAVAHFGFKLNGVLAFWLVFILTRPLGASTGDLLSQPVADGGLGLGTVGTSVIFLAVTVGLVGFIIVRQNRERNTSTAQPKPVTESD